MNEWCSAVQISADPSEPDDLCDLDEFIYFVIVNKDVEGFALHVEAIDCTTHAAIMLGASISGCEPRWLAEHIAQAVECLDRLYGNDQAAATFTREFMRLEELRAIHAHHVVERYVIPDQVSHDIPPLVRTPDLVIAPIRNARTRREPQTRRRRVPPSSALQ